MIRLYTQNINTYIHQLNPTFCYVYKCSRLILNPLGMNREWWICCGLGGVTAAAVADMHEEARDLAGRAGDCSGAVV